VPCRNLAERHPKFVNRTVVHFDMIAAILLEGARQSLLFDHDHSYAGRHVARQLPIRVASWALAMKGVSATTPPRHAFRKKIIIAFFLCRI
jgi:hypothetical protein